MINIVLKYCAYLVLALSLQPLILSFPTNVSAEDSTGVSNALTPGDYYKMGRERFLYLTPGTILEAISLYQNAINQDPRFAPAYAGLAEAYSQLGYINMKEKEEYEELYIIAYRNIKKALKLSPNSLATKRALALTYILLNRTSEAKAAATAALLIDPFDTQSMCVLWQATGSRTDNPLILETLDLDPDFVMAHLVLGEAYFTRRVKYGKSVEHLEKAISLSPEMDYAHNMLGTTLRTQGYLAKAISSYLKALKLNPTYSRAYMNLGITLYYMGKMDDTIKYEQKAISLNPWFPDTYYYLASAQERTGNSTEAKRNFETFVELTESEHRYASYVASAKESLRKLNGTAPHKTVQ